MGWALVRSESFADSMNEYLTSATLGLSVDAQIRALAVLQELIRQEEASTER